MERGADCLRTVQLMPLHPKTPSFLASFKSRLVLHFWYRLTQVVLEKRPLNGCSSSSSSYLLALSIWFAEQGLCNGTVSVRLSVHLSQNVPTAANQLHAVNAAGRRAGDIDRLLPDTQQQRCASGECG